MPPDVVLEELEHELESFYDPDEFHREVVYYDVHSPESVSREEAREADKRVDDHVARALFDDGY